MSDQPPRIPPGTPLVVTLTAAQWFGVLSQLTEGPFKTVGPLIGEIERQIMAQTYHNTNALQQAANSNGELQQAPMDATPNQLGRGNGLEDPNDARH